MTEATGGEYCRRCGNETQRRIPDGDNRPRATCGRCGAIEYDNPKLVVACTLYEDDRFLWVRRAIPPYLGCWALPAGFVELGETLREAACRELLEETHLQLRPEQLTLYGTLSLPDVQQIYIALGAPLPSHGYGPSPEASEVAMLTWDEVKSCDLGYPEVTRELVRVLYDILARGEMDRADGRIWDIRGVDPTAVTGS